MIDQAVFKVEWGLLCDRFRREHSAAVAARYYQSLSARMSTEDFRAACRVVFDREEFMPSPDGFVRALQPDPEGAALEQWELCDRVMRGDRRALARMSADGQRVVRLLGGMTKLGQTLEEDARWVRKEFLELFGSVAAAAHHHELPEWTPEGRRVLAGLMSEASPGTVGASSPPDKP